MSADRWERLADLYHAAVALSARDRAALLAEECADDPALQAEVERLVAAHDRSSPPKPTPIASLASVPTDRAPDTGPRRFGHYRAVKEIGRGASSVVFLANRDDGRFDQRVAVKLIEREIDAERVLERLRSAHQILGSRDHPNLARLIDGGTTEQGRPYLVTEYVEGEPIDAYADARRLSIAERLELFLQVCTALSYAHRRRVIHDGLKPSNILVTATGIPKLLDFGIEERDATAATDIYSLGVVLDALLGGGASSGARRQLRADLEPIVVRALRKDARRRYDSVEHLADDIRRYLEEPAVRARPDNRQRTAPAPARRPPVMVAWLVAGVAVFLLGFKIAEWRGRAPAAAAVTPQTDAPAERERVLVSDFTDRVGDPQLVAALSDAFRAGLAESPTVQVFSSRRQGVKTLVTGSIDTAGNGFAFTAQLTRANKGDRPATLLETATDSAGVIRALSRLCERLREQMGESPTSIAATPRLEVVTTPSLAALREYENGTRAVSGGDRTTGVRFLKAAVALDTGFASAYRLMSIAYDDLADRARGADALDHALANELRLPFYERNHTIGSHAVDYATAIDAYNRILERYPNDRRALENLGVLYAARQEYAVQESLLVRAIAVDSSVPALYTGLAMAALNQGKYGAVRRVLDLVERRFPGLRSSQTADIALAASKQDWNAAEREARARLAQAGSDTVELAEALGTLADIIMTQGRLAEGEQHLRHVLALGTRGRMARQSLSAAVRIAYVELRYRHSPAAALATMNTALTRFPLERMEEETRPYDEVARLFADAGRPVRARELITQAARTRLARQRGVSANRRWTLGAIAMAESRPWEGEIEIHGAAENHACPICALPDLARAYEVAGKPDSAIATYERYVNAPWQSRFETDAIELGFAMKRLGELYQQQNDRAKAAAQYTSLLQLWRGADTELEPLVVDVRRRLDQVGGSR